MQKNLSRAHAHNMVSCDTPLRAIDASKEDIYPMKAFIGGAHQG